MTNHSAHFFEILENEQVLPLIKQQANLLILSLYSSNHLTGLREGTYIPQNLPGLPSYTHIFRLLLLSLQVQTLAIQNNYFQNVPYISQGPAFAVPPA